MLFNSFSFILFFFAVITVYNFPLRWGFKKLFLLAASYVFYAAWNPPFVLLLWISTLVDWFAARKIHTSERTGTRRMYLGLSLLVNLGLLGFFKSSSFLLENVNFLTNFIGLKSAAPLPSIILPVGISFYTFQTLSYTLDIYHRKSKPWDSFLDYALYVTFFPQLVAGPIVRAVDFLPQCREPKRTSREQLSWGLFLMLFGLFQKMVVADGLLAPIAEKVFDSGEPMYALSAWTGVLAFSGQILCDFSGYSTCAIGIALCLGFNLPTNFHSPYASIGFSDFWSRWHISLSTWLRDYLYIPLGGNRKGVGRTLINLMITMLLGGLWHGASWTFILWGGIHGFYLVIEHALRKIIPPSRFWQSTAAKLLLAVTTYVMICFAWVFFRANSIGQAYVMLQEMVGIPTAFHGAGTIDAYMAAAVLGITLIIFGAQFIFRDETFESVAERFPAWIWTLCIVLMIVSLVILTGEDRAFIYFQF